jgi:predicted SAM-dependent methyltransferase
MTLGRVGRLKDAVRRRVSWLKAKRCLRTAPRPLKLHVGCGNVRFEGWINIDTLPLRSVDVVWDLRWGLPVEDGSCIFIYSEHLLEHLSVHDGLAFLRACHRALCGGGVVRLAMPSLEFLLERASSPRWREQDWLSWPEYKSIQTRAEMLNVAFRAWGHQYLYDREELHRRLQEAGFGTAVDAARGESSHPDLRDRETRRDSLLICEAQRT